VGRRVSDALRDAFERAGGRSDVPGTWLDFGCGAGRVARHVSAWPFVEELWGVDVDAEAIGWARANLSGRFETIAPAPPTGLPPNRFDVAYAVSVFTHLDARGEERWLAELHRVLKPGGFLVASTSSPSLSYVRPDMTAEQRDSLERRGFLFLRGGVRDFNEESAFHSNDYLLRTWGRLFGQRLFVEYGAAGYQDLSVWQKW